MRVLSATHRDLDALVAKGSFRADLLARLAGFRLRLPPLWQRREDIGLLVSRLLGARRNELSSELQFEPEAARRLFGYQWPLNIRELDNCLRAATVLARGGAIAEEHLPEQLRMALQSPTAEPSRDWSGAEREQRDEADPALPSASGQRQRGRAAAGQSAHSGAALAQALPARSARLPGVSRCSTSSSSGKNRVRTISSGNGRGRCLSSTHASRIWPSSISSAGSARVRLGPTHDIVEAHRHPSQRPEPRLYREQVVEMGGFAIANVQLDHGHVEAAPHHLLVRRAAAPQVFQPAAFEIRDVVGMVHDAHHVRLGHADPLHGLALASDPE